MKVLRIIVFLMSLFVCSDATYGVKRPEPGRVTSTFFDLPKDTPGLLRCKQSKAINSKNAYCWHVIVPGTKADEAFDNEPHRLVAIENAMDKEGNIYFPSDGTQPTTEEAAEYSCANVKDEKVTEWYMKMFGVIDHNENRITAGYDKDRLSAQVIQDTTDNDNFKNAFKEIAKSSVGRVLLYRILLEIRRKLDKELDYKATYEGALDERLACTSIKIEKDDPSFSYTRGTIFFDRPKVVSTIIGPKISEDTKCLDPKWSSMRNQYKGSYAIIPEENTHPADISLFHELCHWFHFLKNQSRYLKELSSSKILSNYNVWLYYWGGGSKQPYLEQVSGFQWKNSSTKSACIEEIRNILGMPIESDGFENGDDLSENSYRAQKKFPLRFGHTNIGFIEDNCVIEKVFNNFKECSKIECDNVDFGWNLEQFQHGIGRSFALFPQKI